MVEGRRKNSAVDARRDLAERTKKFALRIIRLASKLPKSDVARVIGRQVLRSGTSVGANVEEARAAQSRRDFISKMQIALKEARETVYWLRLLVRAEVVAGEQTLTLIREATELTCILGACVVSAKRNAGIEG